MSTTHTPPYLDAPDLDIASPTEARGLASLGLIWMPSEAISAVSFALLPLTIGLLQRNALQRELLRFDLPIAGQDGWPLVASLIALILSGIVAAKGAKRPGPTGPRIWAATLPLLSLLGVVAALAFPATPLVHAFGAGLLVSALTLAARLRPLRPDSKWMRLVAPALALGLLSFGGGLSMAFQSLAMTSVETGIEEGIARIEAATTATQDLGRVDWRDFTGLSAGQGTGAVADTNIAAMAASRTTLQQISLAQRTFSMGFDSLLHQATVLDEIDHDGRLDRLTQAYAGLVLALDQRLDEPPRLGQFPDPAPLARQEGWSEDIGQVVVGRRAFGAWAALGDLITEIEPPVGSAALHEPWSRLSTHRSRAAEDARHTLTERWQADALSPGGGGSPLRDLLEARLGEADGLPSVGAFTELMDLPFSSAMGLVGPSAGCRDQGFPLEPTRPSRSKTGGFMHFVECFGRGPGGQADLMVRLVYVDKRAQAVPPAALPTEIYTLFLVPVGDQAETYRDQVGNAIAEAARTRGHAISLPDGRSRLLPRFTITTTTRGVQLCSDSGRSADTATFRETARTGLVFRAVPAETGC